jgi:tetratricopeptide (TPR) repeat protein
MMRPHLLFALSLALLAPSVTSCGGDATPAENVTAGSTALGKSDWKAAKESFEKALVKLPASDPAFKRAKLGQIEALIQLEPDRAKTEFLAYAAAADTSAESKDWRNVMSKLTAKAKFKEAIAILEAGLKQHPGDGDIKAMGDAIKVAAENAGDADALGSLAGLGYL